MIRNLLKWAGGKSQLLSEIVPRLPSGFVTYYEPFMGGGALFFHLARAGLIRNAFLSDVNWDLITLYKAVQDDPEGVDRQISTLEFNNNRLDYYRARSLFNELPESESTRRAALMLYLNRHCFNGLHRYNSTGKFNVPFGNYRNPSMPGREELLEFAGLLRKAVLEVSDFQEILGRARKGDFVYMDPPYVPLSKTSAFTSYTMNGFSLEDQSRLARVARELDSRGARFMISHSATHIVKDLFSGFNLHEVKARRAINSIGTGRGAIAELIITNYDA